MTFLDKIPLWVYVLIIGILVIFIWYKLPYLLKAQIKRVFSSKIILPLIFFGIYYFWFTRDIIITENQSHFWMPIVGLALLLVFTMLGSWRYQTKQIVASNFHGSYTRALRVNGFVILNIGGISADIGVKIPMAQKILVVREETFQLMEQGAVSIARVSPVAFEVLDPDVKELIERTYYLKVAKEKVFYGWFDDINMLDWTPEELEKLESGEKKDRLYDLLKKEFNLNNPSIKELYRYAKNISAGYNKQSSVLKNVIQDTEEGVEHFKRQKMAYSDKEEKFEKSEGYEG